MKKSIVVFLVVLAATQVRAEDESKARAGLERFLKDTLAPGDKLDRILRDRGMESVNKGAMGFTRFGEFTASVDSRTGFVTYYSSFKPLLYVYGKDSAGKARSADDRAAEIARRARFTLEDDVKRAQDFLARHYPDYARRRFELTAKARVDEDALVMDDLVFIERPVDGVVACWPNRIDISLNPENGAVVTWIADARRVESRIKPKLGKDEARRAALAHYAEKLSEKNRDWILKEAPVELVATSGPKGPRTAWIVGHWILVDAETGETSLSGERR